ALGPTGDLEGTVGDDLVGVHVRRRSGTALDDTDGELVVQLAGLDLLTGGVDEVRPLVVARPDLGIRPRRGLLDAGEGAHEIRVDGDGAARDREVLTGPSRMHSPIRGIGDLETADRIGLSASGRGLSDQRSGRGG